MSQSAAGELFEVSLEDQIEYILHIIKMVVLMAQVVNGMPLQEYADWELGRMRAVLRTLEGLR